MEERTKDLLHRIAPGEVAVIDHEDLDQVICEGLAARRPAAVVNAARSISGRYPNTGPLALLGAGITLIDACGPAVMEQIRDGDEIRIDGGRILANGREVATGAPLDNPAVERALLEAEGAVAGELERFVANTLEHLVRERDLFLRGVGIPRIRAPITGRHVLVVVRGRDYAKDIRTLRPYISDVRPAIIAVDGAADALLEEGLRPDVIVGDMDSVSTDALTCGAELVVHAYPDGRAPGLERIEALGLDATTLPSGGTSQDVALLLAYEHDPELIVALGMQTNLIEFLDKGRGGMASTFLVRLKVGPKLVDVKGVNRLYRSQVRTRDVLLMVGAALLAMLTVVWISEPLRTLAQSLLDWGLEVWFNVRQVFR